jgi:hypothetical protein
MRWKFSHLKNTLAPVRSSAVREVRTGVRWATPRRRSGGGGDVGKVDGEVGSSWVEA